MNNWDKQDLSALESCVRDILTRKLAELSGGISGYDRTTGGVTLVKVPQISTDESNRMDTGKAGDVVYTKDLFTLEESPRLGTGIMEMKDTTFDWTLKYDEVDYIIDGELTIINQGKKVTAKAGEIIYIPKDSQIQFSVNGFARFLYVTYPANWANL